MRIFKGEAAPTIAHEKLDSYKSALSTMKSVTHIKTYAKSLEIFTSQHQNRPFTIERAILKHQKRNF